GEVPEPLAAAPPDDGDLAVHVEGLQHQPDVPVPVPPVLEPVVARSVLELAREERPAPLELSEHVAAKRRVLVQELAPPPIALEGRRSAVPSHARAEERHRLDRIDERVELDELALLPEEAVELPGVEGAEPAPEDEVLRGRDRRDQVELEEAEPPDGVEHAPSRAVEELRADGDPPRLIR